MENVPVISRMYSDWPGPDSTEITFLKYHIGGNPDASQI